MTSTTATQPAAATMTARTGTDHSTPATGGENKPAKPKVPAPERRGRLVIALMQNASGLTRDELAAKLDCSPGVVAYTLKDARAELKRTGYAVDEDSETKKLTLTPPKQ